jgi:hypothetical protein
MDDETNITPLIPESSTSESTTVEVIMNSRDQPLSSIRLWHVLSPTWQRPVRSPMDPVMQLQELALQVGSVVLPRQPIHPWSSILLNGEEWQPVQVNADVVEKRGEYFLLPLLRSLPYASQRLWQLQVRSNSWLSAWQRPVGLAEPTKSLLIESVINNLSIPAFFFEVSVEDGVEHNQVIDGQTDYTYTVWFFFTNSAWSTVKTLQTSMACCSGVSWIVATQEVGHSKLANDFRPTRKCE